MPLIHEVAYDAFPGAQAARVRRRCFSNISRNGSLLPAATRERLECLSRGCGAVLIYLSAVIFFVCSRRPLGFKPSIRALAGSGAPLIPPLICTHDGWLGAAWLGCLDFLALCRPLAPCWHGCVLGSLLLFSVLRVVEASALSWLVAPS
jgi:hypothetical protein